jgi:hypothetical protein
MTLNRNSFVRAAQLLLAAIVITLTFAVVGHAAQSLTTVNAMRVSYTLSSGGYSSAITPPVNKPVLVIADQIGVSSDNVGSSFMTVVSSPYDEELVWNGIESNGGGLTSGFSPSFGSHIMYIDNGHYVQLEVNNSTSFVVYNGYGASQKGNVTLIW